MMKSQTFGMEPTLTTTPDVAPRHESPMSPDSRTQSLLKSTPEEDAARAIYEARQSFLAFHYF